MNYLVGNALANIALYENVIHNCEHVQDARNNTINVIVSNVLKQKIFLFNNTYYCIRRNVEYIILNVVHLIRERAGKYALPR